MGDALALALAILAFGLPALGQERPESILPPGFDQPPTPSPSPVPATQQTPRNVAPQAPATTPLAGLSDSVTPTEPLSEVSGTPLPIDPVLIAEYEMPSYARRSLSRIGIVGQAQGGLSPTAFGSADGRYLEALMSRLRAPIASRWLSIGLRRALASRVDTPANVNGADFAAERAWLLLRMGEANVSRAIIEAVDPDNYTPKLFEAAMQSALASGDPALVCPVVDDAKRVSSDRAWILAEAMCRALLGVPGEAGALIDAARRRGVARGTDLLLAEKVVGAGAAGRRAVTIDWNDVDHLTIWRYGLAMATGVPIPQELLDSANPRVHYWRALSPMLDAKTRAVFAERAAAQGVLSNIALVDLFGEIEQADDQPIAEGTIARDLRTAYSEQDRTRRLAALRALWGDPKAFLTPYPRLLLTARAAAGVAAAKDTPEADKLIAAMLSAGLHKQASEWRDFVDVGSQGWALLTLGERSFIGKVSVGDFNRYRGGPSDSAGIKPKLLLAGLAGLGLLDTGVSTSIARDLEVDLGSQNSWTKALDQAVIARQPGTVVLLCAIGMQTTDWQGVSPLALYNILSALNRVGLEGEARMIAVEALTRL